MRLIDADALPRHKQLEAFGNGQYEYVDIVYGNDIDTAPTINAVPKQHLVKWAHVIRCKDCIYWQDNNGGYPVDGCKWRQDETPDPDDYCSCGERQQDKEGE